MSQELPHTYLQGAWITCARCDYRYKAVDMQWQRGKLLCLANCFDRGEIGLLGVFPVRVAAVLEDGKEELAPVEILRDPDLFTEADEFNI